MSNVTPPSSAERFAEFLLRHRIALFVTGLILLAVSTWIARDLKFDQSIESLYAADDPHLANYLESKRLFGGDEFLIVAWREPELFQPGTLRLDYEADERIQAMAERLGNIPGVNPVSTQTLSRVMLFPFKKERVLDIVEGLLVNRERDVTAIVIRLTPETSTDLRAETFRQIRAVADAHDPPAYVVGEALHIHDMFRYVQEDGSRLFLISFALLSSVLLILFRSLRWVLLPALIVALAIEMTYGLLVLSGVSLSMVSAILNSLVTIIGVATVTHVAVQYRERRTLQPPRDALQKTLADLLGPIFWTCLTTAVGFLALAASRITPVRSFGLMMSLASMLVFVSVILVLPGGILLLARWQNDPRRAPAEGLLIAILDRVAAFVRRYPLGTASGLVALIVMTGLGFLRLRVETDFSKNFREASPLVQSLRFVERELGGAGSLEVNFPAPSVLEEEDVYRVADLADELRQLRDDEGALITQANALSDGLLLIPNIPFVSGTPTKKLNLIRKSQPEFESILYNSAEKRMRVFLRSREQQSADRKNRVIDEAEAIARKYDPDAKVSGVFVLLTFLIDSLLSDQVTSFLYASIGLLVVMTLAFRSLKFGLVGLVPNVFPIVLVIGGMGWADVPINIATAMITCVSLGLTVDSSIHYIAAFRRCRRQGESSEEALAHTNRDVGRALTFANLALVAGFSVLTASHFIPLVYFGFLVSAAMFGGLLGNLLLLPILLRRLDPMPAGE